MAKERVMYLFRLSGSERPFRRAGFFLNYFAALGVVVSIGFVFAILREEAPLSIAMLFLLAAWIAAASLTYLRAVVALVDEGEALRIVYPLKEIRVELSNLERVRAVVGTISGGMNLEVTLRTGESIRSQLMALDGTWHAQRALKEMMLRNGIDYVEK